MEILQLLDILIYLYTAPLYLFKYMHLLNLWIEIKTLG